MNAASCRAEAANHRLALSKSGGRGTALSLKERFDAKWIAVPESGCWLWTDSTHRTGYGQIFIRDRKNGVARNVRASRLAWELYRGSIPEGLYVCHKCDVRLCVNPNHLFLGTHSDNIRDMWRKGRQGTRKSVGKLTTDQVKRIRAETHVRGCDFARMFGVTQAAISLVRKGVVWRDVA